jgi:hypothetical protein
MRIYAEKPGHASRQIISDFVIAWWIGIWVWIGMRIHDLVNGLAGPGETIEEAGTSFAGSLIEAGRRVADLPVVGEGLQFALNAVAEAGVTLQRAGQAQQDAVNTLALWLGVLVAFLPIAFVLFHYLPDRVRWIREAAAASRARGPAAENLYLFALRAIATRPLRELLRATPDPGRAFATGDYEALAALELDELGLRAVPSRRRTPRG